MVFQQPAKPIGNLIAYPFQGQASEKGNTLFLDPAADFRMSFANQLEVLKTLKRVSEADLDHLITVLNLKRTPINQQGPVNYSGTNQEQLANLLKCDFIKWASENQASVSEPLWYAMISNVGRISPGGITYCHEFSRQYPKYSAAETEKKILQALNNSAPQTCDYIRSIGFDCKRNCGVKAPAGLINKGKSTKGTSAPQMDMTGAQESVKKIIELAQKDRKKVALEIAKTPEYVGALALLAEHDGAALEAAIQQIKSFGVTASDIQSIRKAVKGTLKQRKLRVVQPDETKPDIYVKDLIPDAPIASNLVVPENYKLSSSGLIKEEWREDHSGNSIPVTKEISSSPILITGRTVGMDSQVESVRLSWLRDGAWKHSLIDRGIIATNRTITSLASLGLPVIDSTAGDLVEYLLKFENANIQVLPIARVSTQLGWQPDTSSFLWGKTLIRSDGMTMTGIDLEEDDPLNWNSEWVTFKAEDEGNDQVAKGFQKKGSCETWIEMANRLYPHPKVIGAIYLSLAVPFLKVLDVPNFVLDLCNPTSSGKTITLRVAGSCWGNPDETSPNSVVQTWSNTQVGIERLAMMLNGLPLILDDTKLAGTGANKEKAGALVSNTIYTFSKGRGKGRGSIKSLRKTGSWRSILFSTGEQPAVEYTADGGTRPRVLTLWGPPLGKTDHTTGMLANEIDLLAKQSYGHSGPKVVQFILDNHNQWELWRKTYQEYQKRFLEKAGSDGVAIRISSYFAFLATVIPLINAALPGLRKDIPMHDIIDHLWNAALAGIEDTDRATVGLKEVYQWAARNQAKFYKRIKDDDKPKTYEPHSGWAGFWKEGDNWTEIAFDTKVAIKILEDAGLDSGAIIRVWKERGWIEVPKKGMGVLRSINGVKTNCYSLKRTAIEQVVEMGEDRVAAFASQVQEKIMTLVSKDSSAATLNQLAVKIEGVIKTHQISLSIFSKPEEEPINPFALASGRR